MVSYLPEQLDTEETKVEDTQEVAEPEISNIPEYLIETLDEPRSEATPESSKKVEEPAKEVLKIGDTEIPLDAEVVFSDEVKAPLKHVKEQYTNLRSRYGELGQKEEAARQKAAQLERDIQIFQLEKKELDEIKAALSSGNKKEAIDKFFMKAGINPASWWPQFFDETAHIYEQRSQMNDEEKRLATLQAENEILKKTVEETKQTVTSKEQTEQLSRNLMESVEKAGLSMQDIQGVWQRVQEVEGKVAKGETGDLPVESIQFVKSFRASSPQQQMQMLVGEAAVNRATSIALSIANELDSELAKDDNVVVDLRSQLLNPYRNPKMTREDFKDYLKTRWSAKLNGKSQEKGDGVEVVGKKEEAKPSSKPAQRQPLTMWDLKR